MRGTGAAGDTGSTGSTGDTARAPALLALAHGTRDPQGVRAVEELVHRVRRARPAVRVELAWLGLVHPAVPEALAGLEGPVVAVPLLLARGYHVRADIPALLTASGRADVVVTDPLGPSPLLADALAARLEEAGRPAGCAPVVLAAAGSGDVRARADTLRSARLLAARLKAPVTAAFLGGEGPEPAQAVAKWAGQHVSVATHPLAPGFFARRLEGLGVRVAAPLGAHRSVVEAVWARYGAALDAAGTGR